MRYETRLLETGWSVWDTKANTVAIVEGCWHVGMSLDDADDLMNLLDHKMLASSERSLQNVI